jgi:hypothetical protein
MPWIGARRHGFGASMGPRECFMTFILGAVCYGLLAPVALIGLFESKGMHAALEA